MNNDTKKTKEQLKQEIMDIVNTFDAYGVYLVHLSLKELDETGKMNESIKLFAEWKGMSEEEFKARLPKDVLERITG